MRADYSQKFVDICRPKVAERDVNVFVRMSFAPVNYYPAKGPRLNEELADLCPLNLDFCYLIISNELFPPLARMTTPASSQSTRYFIPI